MERQCAALWANQKKDSCDLIRCSVAVTLKYVGLPRDHAGDSRSRETQLTDVSVGLMQMVDASYGYCYYIFI